MRQIDKGKNKNTMNDMNKVWVFRSDTKIMKISVIRIPSASELYSHVKSSFKNMMIRKIPRQNVLFMHAAPCSCEKEIVICFTVFF